MPVVRVLPGAPEIMQSGDRAMNDFDFMGLALVEARKAAVAAEVPIGAVLTFGGIVIAQAHNLREADKDATAHAEMLVIRDACRETWTLAVIRNHFVCHDRTLPDVCGSFGNEPSGPTGIRESGFSRRVQWNQYLMLFNILH